MSEPTPPTRWYHVVAVIVIILVMACAGSITN